MVKNKHNQSLGSDIKRSDDRIRKTGEIFTPEEEIHRMVDSLSEYEIANNTFLDLCAGNGNFSSVLLERGVPLEHIYGIEYMEDNFFELCDRLNIQDQCCKLCTYLVLSDEYVDVKDSSDKVILKKGNYLRCDALFKEFPLLFDQETVLGCEWVPVDEVAHREHQDGEDASIITR